MLEQGTAYRESTRLDIRETIAYGLERVGWCIADGVVSPELAAELGDEMLALWQSGDFRPAGIGRGANFHINTQQRSDWVRWLDPQQPTPGQQRLLAWMEELRLTLNRELQLGLFEYEGHLAIYPPGSHYSKHLDRFQGTEQRTLTCVLYLNRDWEATDGGALRIYCDPSDAGCYRDILPLDGRLVCFLSGRFAHEVLPARRNRLSITGWFKARS
ncbi:MAG: 2OG-Fe(II) oxygenase [Chromatiaceae bacterium]|nr:2OG-Fe(II) oxygenase [Chromatiaceae bacterium]